MSSDNSNDHHHFSQAIGICHSYTIKQFCLLQSIIFYISYGSLANSNALQFRKRQSISITCFS